MPSLVHDGQHFIFICSFAERSIPKDAGFRWSQESRRWYTSSLAAAARLRSYAVETAKSLLDRTIIRIEPWQKPLPPLADKLMPHQREAVLFALSRNRCYLGLDPGLGKTAVAAIITAALGTRVIYITPPFLVRNVEDEFNRWAPGTRLEIIRDSMLSELTKWRFFDRRNMILIVDEAHRFKNGDAKRTKFLLDLINRVEFNRVIFMSGTPMPNRPLELFPVLSSQAPQTIDYMNRFEYGRRYCAGHQTDYGWDFTGASNVPELAAKVIHPSGPFMLRQKKALLNLPPKTEELFIVSDDMSPTLAKLDHTLKETCGDADRIIEFIEDGRLNNSASLPVASYRRMLGSAKVKPAAVYIESLLDETDEAVLVFAYHRGVIANLAKALAPHMPYVITGDTPMRLRHEQVKEFQATPHRRLFIGNYQAMGTGFTLTKATRVIFVEFDYVPGNNEQAGDRAHRIGQNSPVLVQYITYKDSLDKQILEIILRKRRSIAYV